MDDADFRDGMAVSACTSRSLDPSLAQASRHHPSDRLRQVRRAHELLASDCTVRAGDPDDVARNGRPAPGHRDRGFGASTGLVAQVS